MRTGGTPAGADGADQFADLQFIAHGDAHRAQMQKRGGQAVAVVENHRAAGIKQIVLGERHPPRGGRAHRRARGRRHVHPIVRTARCAVVDALTAVDPGQAPAQRPDKRAVYLHQPGRILDAPGLGGGDQRPLAANARELLRRRGHGALRDAVDALYAILPLRHLNDEFAAVIDAQHAARRGIAVKSSDKIAVGQHVQGQLIQGHRGRGIDPAPNQPALYRLPGQGRAVGARGRRGLNQQRGQGQRQ